MSPFLKNENINEIQDQRKKWNQIRKWERRNEEMKGKFSFYNLSNFSDSFSYLKGTQNANGKV